MNNVALEVKNLLNSLNKDPLNLKKIRKEMDSISRIKQIKNYSYLEDLLNPETRKDARIPCEHPTPSATFQLKHSLFIPTNRKGCFLIKCNPFFLAQQSIMGASDMVKYKASQTAVSYIYMRCYTSNTPASTCFTLESNDLDGITDINGSSYTWYRLDIGQTVPDNVFSLYRLVSASISAKYTGSLTDMSGIIGGAVMYDDDSRIGALGYDVKAFGKPVPYNFDPTRGGINGAFWLKKGEAVFDNYRNAFYHQENPACEGVRMLYFPFDNSYQDYYKVLTKDQIKVVFPPIPNTIKLEEYYFYVDPEYYKSGFYWYIYGQGLPKESSCIRLDFYFNYECLPSPEFLNFASVKSLPYVLTPEEKEKIIEEFKKKFIQ